MLTKQRDLSNQRDTKIRDILIISTINDLCGVFKISIKFPKPDVNTYIGSEIDLYDRFYGYTFQIGDVLYRFDSGVNKEEWSSSLLTNNNAKKIIGISFANEKHILYPKRQISLRSFFNTYFVNANFKENEVFDFFLRETKEAINKAIEESAFKTIFNMNSLGSLESFKEKLSSELLKFNDLCCYIFDGEKDGQKLKLSESDLSIIKRNFIDKNRYKYLLNDSDFSKCFLTAEYLYSIIKEQKSLDYSSVVFDYFKAVELLIGYYAIEDKKYLTFCSAKHSCDECSKNNKCFHYVLDDGRRCLATNNSSMLYKINNMLLNKKMHILSEQGTYSVYLALNDYRGNSRNGYIHTDILYSMEEVETIRRNTWACLYYVLGGFKLPKELQEQKDFFNDSYSAFYNIIKHQMPYSAAKKLVFEKDGNFINAYWDYNNYLEETKYDEKTTTIITPLVFYAVEDFSKDPNEMDEKEKSKLKRIVLSPENLPENIYRVFDGKKIKIEF